LSTSKESTPTWAVAVACAGVSCTERLLDVKESPVPSLPRVVVAASAKVQERMSRMADEGSYSFLYPSMALYQADQADWGAWAVQRREPSRSNRPRAQCTQPPRNIAKHAFDQVASNETFSGSVHVVAWCSRVMATSSTVACTLFPTNCAAFLSCAVIVNYAADNEVETPASSG
jgi:hypothetical protein